MYKYAGVVKQYPLGILISFFMEGPDFIFFFQVVFNMRCYGFDLGIRISMCYDKELANGIIGIRKVNLYYARPLLFQYSIYDFTAQIVRGALLSFFHPLI